MEKPEQYRKCMLHQQQLCDYTESEWYNNLRKHMNGALGINTHYIDKVNFRDTLHIASPERDLGLLCLDIEQKMKECRGLPLCILPEVLQGIYSSVKQQYDEARKTA